MAAAMPIRQALALRIDLIRGPHERQRHAGKRSERTRISLTLIRATRVSEPRGTTSGTCCAARKL